MAAICDDQVSISSSCEIIDALTEASEDLSVYIDVTKNESMAYSPAFKIDESMTTSQYAQVIFDDIKDSYPLDLDLVCCYTLSPGIEPGHGDRVALYRLPYLQPHEYVAYVWTHVQTEQEMEVTFIHTALPNEEDFYQFQYLKGDNNIAGASIPFHLRAPGTSTQEVCGVREEGDLLVVQTPHTSLQEKAADIESKYTGLLELSEQLTDELNLKNQSFLVLEKQHISLLGTVRVLSTTTTRLEVLEKALNVKSEEVAQLEADLTASQTKCGGMTAELSVAIEEREHLAKMLDQEIKARKLLLTEKKELVDRIDDTSNMLNATAKSKELAIEEIRTQIQQQDKLRQELAAAKEEAGNAEAELVLLKQELAKTKEKEIGSFDVASVMSSLGAKIEEKDREVMEKDKELALLKQVEASVSSMEIHEKCLEDADNRAECLEKEKGDMLEENGLLKQKVCQLEMEKVELVQRLEAGAAHYRKLAAEKSTWEKAKIVKPSLIVDKYTDKIDSLEHRIVQLCEELKQARMWQDMKLSQINRAVSHNSSMTMDRDGDSMGSSISNMDSVKINDAITTSQEVPTSQMPSLFHPFPSTLETAPRTVSDPTLPVPLLPENMDPTVLIPELQPRAPAPYSSGSSSEESPEEAAPKASKVAHLDCPMCDETFAAGCSELLQKHVDHHLDNVVECPICGKTYDTKNQLVYEEHVQEHFKEQNQSVEIRGWDLGID